MLILDINISNNFDNHEIIEVKQEKNFTDYDEINFENIITLNGKKYFYDYL